MFPPLRPAFFGSVPYYVVEWLLAAFMSAVLFYLKGHALTFEHELGARGLSLCDFAVIIKGLPAWTRAADIAAMMEQFGTVQRFATCAGAEQGGTGGLLSPIRLRSLSCAA